VVGTLIGHYRIVSAIGSGGMGTVYVGEHTLIGRRAAIKVLNPELSLQREVVDRKSVLTAGYKIGQEAIPLPDATVAILRPMMVSRKLAAEVFNALITASQVKGSCVGLDLATATYFSSKKTQSVFLPCFPRGP
jgi:serine/threonine protein kinase